MPEEIIDCHIHPPDESGSESYYLKITDPLDFVGRLKRAGITRACGACGMPGKQPGGPEGLRRANEIAYAFRDRFPDFYVPAVQANPDAIEASCQGIEEGHRRGVRWIGELVWYLFKATDKYDTREARRIYDLAQQLGMVLNLHCNDLGIVECLCREFRGLPFVLAHPREHRDYIKERVALVARHPNLYLDLSGSGLHRYGMLRYAIDQAGPEKFIFGTDFPISAPAGFVADVRFEPITDRERELVFSGNFKRLTGIE